jgi:hypothetical protein
MKIFLLTLALCIVFPMFGQQDSITSQQTNNSVLKDSISRFTWGYDGLTDFVVITLDSLLSNKELYDLTLNWIKETYKMPDKVIQTSIDSQLIRIEGISANALTVQSSLIISRFDMKYTIEFRFKDGKIKFDPISLYTYQPPSQYSAGGWYPFPIDDGSSFYKYDKKTKLYEIIKKFQSYPQELPDVFNDLSLSLFYYLQKSKDSNSKETKDPSDDW